MTWREYQERLPPDGITLSAGQSIHDILRRNVFPFIPVLDPKKPNTWNANQQRYMEEFSKALVRHINIVLTNPAPIRGLMPRLSLLGWESRGLRKWKTR